MATHHLLNKESKNETELLVAQALVDLENNSAELKKELRPIQIATAKEVSTTTNIISRIQHYTFPNT